jgi:hypothetical protein
MTRFTCFVLLNITFAIWTNTLNTFVEKVYTVKLGYNELGYNEHPVITNKMKSNGWF